MQRHQFITAKSRFFVAKENYDAQGIAKIAYKDSLPLSVKNGISTGAVDENIYLAFRLHNDADTSVQLYFFPGIYYNKIDLFKQDSAGNLHTISAKLPDVKDSLGYRGIELLPGERCAIYAHIKSIRSHTSILRPALMHSNDVASWRLSFRNVESDIRVFSYVIAGMLLMMIFYAFINYVQTSQPQFIFYSLYAFLLGSLFFLYAQNNRTTTSFNYFLESYLDFSLQLAAHFFYFLFVQHFLDTPGRFPLLNKLLSYSRWLVIICFAVYSYCYFAGLPFSILNTFENFSKYFLIGFGIIIVYAGLIKKDKLLKYLMLGNVFLILLSLFSLLIAVLGWRLFPTGSLLNRSLAYYETGVVLELVFFLAGLIYKNRKELITRTAEREKLKSENERKELEKQVAILQAQQEERNRISTDMHDELGSGMTAIRLMSELAKEKLKSNPLPEIDKISSSANDLLIKMNAIIWSMSPSNDSLVNLLSYIRTYAIEFFENTPVHCSVILPADIPAREVTGEKRRNTFLTIKETLNNTLKHAKATEVKIDVSINEALKIEIHDNGIGIETGKIGPYSNGLRNMQRRMQNTGGEYKVMKKDGTLTVLLIPL
ncbi:MAG: histidine kinase [Chitinophagaceae bacterium]|nr:histidine kinase [Chitinophagaceae bacterium]